MFVGSIARDLLKLFELSPAFDLRTCLVCLMFGWPCNISGLWILKCANLSRYIRSIQMLIQIISDISNYFNIYHIYIIFIRFINIHFRSVLIQRFPPSIGGSTALASPTDPRRGDWSTSTWWIGGSVRMTAGAGRACFFWGVVGWVIFMGFHMGEYGIRVDTCGTTIIYINMPYIYILYIYIYTVYTYIYMYIWW